MSEPEGSLPIPEGPWGLPGVGAGHGGDDQTHTPPDKKKQRSRRRERQARRSRKLNRRK